MAGFIGARASVVSSGAERKQTYAITTTTTSLTGLAYTPTKVHVYHNGIRLVDGTDYTATDGSSITLNTAAENGDEVVVISYATFQTSDTVSAANGGTFAGNVEHTGTLTASGDLNANTIKDATGANTAITIDSSGVVKTPAKPMFRVTGSGGISLPDNTWTKAAFNSTEFDVGGYYDTTNYRYTPLVAGRYHINARAYITWGSVAIENVRISIYKNGSIYQQMNRYSSGTSNVYGSVQLNTLIDLNGSTDYIEVFVRQNISNDAYYYIDGANGEFSGFLIS